MLQCLIDFASANATGVCSLLIMGDFNYGMIQLKLPEANYDMDPCLLVLFAGIKIMRKQDVIYVFTVILQIIDCEHSPVREWKNFLF